MNVSLTISVSCLVFCFLMFFYFKWYIKRRISATELLTERRKEVYSLIAEIDSITDRDAQLVEERIKNLRALLEDTDKRIAVYVKELEKSRTGEALYTSLGRGIRAALKNPVEPIIQPPQAVIRRESESLVVQSAPIFRTPSKQQIRAQIAALVKEGLSPEEIALRLDISLAEVDLALNLLTRSTG